MKVKINVKIFCESVKTIVLVLNTWKVNFNSESVPYLGLLYFFSVLWNIFQNSIGDFRLSSVEIRDMLIILLCLSFCTFWKFGTSKLWIVDSLSVVEAVLWLVWFFDEMMRGTRSTAAPTKKDWNSLHCNTAILPFYLWFFYARS